jgi:lipopolysaccharide/colanic/teichoic acid biosynthesis glycosyltransferase
MDTTIEILFYKSVMMFYVAFLLTLISKIKIMYNEIQTTSGVFIKTTTEKKTKKCYAFKEMITNNEDEPSSLFQCINFSSKEIREKMTNVFCFV